MSLQKWPLEKLIMKKKGGNSNTRKFREYYQGHAWCWPPGKTCGKTRGKKKKKNWPYKRVCIPLGLNIEAGLI